MTGYEHWQKAEEFVRDYRTAEAQVHATLALAAAVLAAGGRQIPLDSPISDWMEAALGAD